MSKAQPFAHALINSLLPEDLSVNPGTVLTNSELKKRLVTFAQRDPQAFNNTVPAIKQFGDLFASYSGISVGLDDIEPDYKKRDAIMNEAEKKLKEASSSNEKTRVYMEAQAKIRQLTLDNKGDLGLMARSGGRGNVNQLMKTIASPVVVGDFDGNPVDTLIKRSYSEGLSPMEYWVAADESRGQVIKGQLGTSEPGDVSKVLAAVTNRQVISEEDCGTKNGNMMNTTDPHIIGRYLARDQISGKRNDLVDQRMVDANKSPTMFVRGPMTCEAHEGVCSFCQGLMNNGQRMRIGENAGIRAAQAASEPLTQMALSSKHGVALVEGGASNIPRGLSGLRQFLEAPKSFAYKSTLATSSGKITNIKEAPQGGNYIYVGNKEHYAPPMVKVFAKIGDQVEPGDSLTEGVAHPEEVVKYKGLGEGRKYLVDQLHQIYKGSAGDIDKRNLEHIIKPHLNFVRVENAPEDSTLIPGEIVKQNRIDLVLRNQGEKIPTANAVGRIIAENYLHHTAGSVVNVRMQQEFTTAGITKVNVLPKGSDYKFTPHITSITRSPLLDDNWLNKLGHRYLKSTIMEAAQTGQRAETQGYAPVAAYTRGTTFGKQVNKGRY